MKRGAGTFLRLFVLTCCGVAALLQTTQASCAFQFAIFASGSSGVSLQQWEVTFVQYLNDKLSLQLGCTFNVTPIYQLGQFWDHLVQGNLDFALVDATTFACLNVRVLRRPA